jgi:hypothetical protein
MKFFGLGMLNKRASLLEAPFVHVGSVEVLSINFKLLRLQHRLRG